jgi:hypothetical protein
MNCVLRKWGKIEISPRVSRRGVEAAENSWRWGGGSRYGRGSRSTNSNTASPEKKRRKETTSPEPATEPCRLDAYPHGGTERKPGEHDCVGNLPRRRFLNGSGEWRGGEELREVGGSGISRPWILAGKKRAEVSLLPRERARALADSKIRPRRAPPEPG